MTNYPSLFLPIFGHTKDFHCVPVDEISSQQLRVGTLVTYCAKSTIGCQKIVAKKIVGNVTWYYLLGHNLSVADGWTPHYRIETQITQSQTNDWIYKVICQVQFALHRLKAIAVND